MSETFDRWAASGTFTYSDLAIYRIVYSGLVLLTLPRASLASEFPGSLFVPPLGPFQVLSGVPPEPVIIGIEVLLALSVACLAVGYYTRAASLATGVLLLASYGLIYSFGQVDHTILFVIVPLVLCGSGWGERISFDSIRRPKDVVRQELPPQWPLRLLSVLIGLAFLTAAIPKILSGWLSFSSQASRGHFLRRYLVDGETGGVSPLLFPVHMNGGWELLDWLTVALEAFLILSVISWRAFRATIAIACIFHLSVLLTLGIVFSSNVIVYGSFVAWAGLATGARRFSCPDLLRRGLASRPALPLLVLCLAAVGLCLQTVAPLNLKFYIAGSIVITGSLFALVHLLVAAGHGWSRTRTRLSPT